MNWIRTALGTTAVVLGFATSLLQVEGNVSVNTMAPRTIVIYNRNAPGSEALALYYKDKRGIPENNIIGLDAPASEEITREQFVTSVSAPLRAILVERGLWVARGKDVVGSKIRFAVLIKGMPLKVRSALPPPAEGEKRHPVNDRDEAALDSELVVLGLNVATKGAVNNPYFRSLTRAVDAPMPPGMILVSRLDAPTEKTVRRMIDDAIAAESRGLWGWAYVDARGITAGPYLEGDRWLINLRDTCRRRGIPVLFENTEPTLPTGFPVRQAALYYGWYAANANGPFAETATQFQPGAIAIHIHSFSAATLRNPNSGWAGPLLERGATVTAGNVYEPYLGMTLNLDLFQDRLMNGLNIAEAAYSATPALSWMGVVLGDPLYRPYGAWFTVSLETSKAKNEWEQFREIVLNRNGNWNVAAPFLEDLGEKLHNPMPEEALASWWRDDNQNDRAVDAFETARKLATQSWQKVQIDWLLIRTLEKMKKTPAVLSAVRRALIGELSESERSLLLKDHDRLVNPPIP